MFTPTTIRRAGWVIFSILLVLAANADAAFISFNDDGAGNGWDVPDNWSLDVVPAVDDYVNISGNYLVEIASAGNVAGFIDVLGGSQVDITGGDLTFGHADGRWFWIGRLSAGTVRQSAGTVRGVGDVDLLIGSSGQYILDGGLLELPDDTWLLGDAQLSVAGDATLTVDDDLVLLGQGVTIQVALIGNAPPTIAVGGDLVLQGNTSLEIDTSAWTSGGPVPIFAVDGNIVGDFTNVTVNGSPRDPANYLRTSSGISIHLGEPSELILVAIAGLGAGCWRRVYRRNHRP